LHASSLRFGNHVPHCLTEQQSEDGPLPDDETIRVLPVQRWGFIRERSDAVARVVADYTGSRLEIRGTDRREFLSIGCQSRRHGKV
jgi:hypothetical protein